VGGTGTAEGSPGQANTGGGGGGGPFIAGNTPPPPQQAAGGVGGSGVVIISYSAAYPELTITGTLTQTNSINTTTGNRVYTFTSGTGTISWGTGPTLEATTGTYWVIKNNSPINYTLNFTGGTLNTVGGPTSMYLQAGNGLTLIYSGANTVYYTF
jgi:hypothetical protein